MKHRRSPTHNYPQDMTHPFSIHASLALRHPIPTLLSPLTSIANTPLSRGGDAPDDFQSNAWVNTSSYRPPLAGLGINYLRDISANLHGQPLAPEHIALQMQVDGDEDLFFFSCEPCGTDIPAGDFPAPTVPYRGLESQYIGQRAVICEPSLGEEPTTHLQLGLDSDIDPMASDIVGLIPDVNMYDKLRRLELSHLGVNPLDTICGTSLHDIGVSYGEPASLTPEDNHTDDILPTTDSGAEQSQSPSPRVIQDIMSILNQPVPEFSFLPASHVNSRSSHSFSPSQPAAPRSSHPVNLGPTNVADSEHHAPSASYNLEYPNSTHSSPILNAHLGIELNELISRAERFRSKYPERDIDRAWLSHFAGKLSNRGELLDDFRCYVTGCDQRNKRRDHILVHVGAHIGQRPFACSVCPLRFLRKNECKRHEASHSGFRPYSCDICGQSFVRQDLVKRHVKRTHGLQDENSSGVVTRQPRKRARRQ